MSAALHEGELLRGLHLQDLPVRLRRASAAPARPEHLADSTPAPDPIELARWQACDQGLREGRAEGLKLGHEEGLRRGRAEAAAAARQASEQAVAEALAPLQQQQEALARLAQGLEQARQALLVAAEDDMVALCWEALCRILGRAVLQPKVVRQQVRHLLSQADPAGMVAVHLHPEDAALMEACAPGAEAQPTSRLGPLRWVADAQVTLGGCIVHGPAGGLDGRLETLLGSCKTVLLAARAQSARANGSQLRSAQSNAGAAP